MKRDFAIHLILGTGILVSGLFAVGISTAQGAGVMGGLGLGVINYQWLYRGAIRFFEAAQEGAVGRRAWMLMAVLRLGFLGVALALLLKLGCPPLGLVVGLSIPMFSQVVWSVYRGGVESEPVRSKEST